MNILKEYNYILKALAFVVLLKLSHLITFSWIMGSHLALFSASNIMGPLSGAFGGLLGSSGIFGLGIVLRLLFFGGLTAKILAFHIPGFFASLYWTTSHWLIRLALPVACMILFSLHPVGYGALPYTFYWSIPVVLYFVRSKNLFLESLGSTFVAHAVGSVIWLYAVPMTSAAWLALIPVVAVERLLFASGMVLAHTLVHTLFAVLTRKHSVRGASHIAIQ